MDDALFTAFFAGAALLNAAAFQQEWVSPGTYSYVVPKGTYRIGMLCIGAGGGGGGLRYIVSCPVIPGETLTITVGAGGAGSASGSTLDGGNTYVSRGTTQLLAAYGGRAGYGTSGGGGGSGTPISANVGGGNGGNGGNGGSGSAGADTRVTEATAPRQSAIARSVAALVQAAQAAAVHPPGHRAAITRVALAAAARAYTARAQVARAAWVREAVALAAVAAQAVRRHQPPLSGAPPPHAAQHMAVGAVPAAHIARGRQVNQAPSALSAARTGSILR
jgi:hypothetical protein